MKLNQSTIFHTKTNSREEIESYIQEVISSPENNPDYLEITMPEDKQSIGIKQIKNMISWIQSRPFQEKNKLAVILGAEKMTIESQNSLLKVLEEPPARSYIFLITKNPKVLLKTVLSRSSIISITDNMDSHIYSKVDITSILDSNTKTHLKTIEIFLKIKDPKQRKAAILSFITAIHEHILNDQTPQSLKNLELISQTEQALQANANTKLLLENLFFNFKR